jgi:hypothetical protein
VRAERICQAAFLSHQAEIALVAARSAAASPRHPLFYKVVGACLFPYTGAAASLLPMLNSLHARGTVLNSQDRPVRRQDRVSGGRVAFLNHSDHLSVRDAPAEYRVQTQTKPVEGPVS